MHRVKHLSWLLVIPVAFFASCGGGDDAPDAPASTTTLTKAQAEQVAEQISAGLGAVFSGTGATKLGGKTLQVQLATISDQEFDVEEQCDQSGTVATSGTISGEANSSSSESTIDIDYDIDQAFDECAADDITIDGTLNSDGNINVTVTEGGIEGTATMSVTGSLDVSGDDVEEGTCGVGISSESSFSEDSVSITVTGTVCDTSIDYSFEESTDDES